jgi:hypothetical protein
MVDEIEVPDILGPTSKKLSSVHPGAFFTNGDVTAVGSPYSLAMLLVFSTGPAPPLIFDVNEVA